MAVDVGVAHDREQPRTRVGAVECAESVERADERVQYQVLGVMRVPAEQSSDPEQRRKGVGR